MFSVSQNVGEDTWRFLGYKASQMTDWSLGQLLKDLEQRLDDPSEDLRNSEIHRAIQIVERELDARAA